jgi:site-specific recombinase XerD
MTNQAVTQLAPRASHSADSTNPHRAGNTQDPVQITFAMRLLHAGIDTSVIAVWLGHVSVETTHIYLHADLELKEKALAKTQPTNAQPGRYQPPDSLLTWLEAL